MTLPPPDPDTIPENLDGIPEEDVRALAASYLDLVRLMTLALHDCTTGYGIYYWNGRGFQITGHPPDALVGQILTGATAGGPDE